MIVVDSSVLVDFFRGVQNAQTNWLLANFEDPDLAITDLSLCEVLQGERTEVSFERARTSLLDFDVHSTGGIELATQSAANYRSLRSHGITIRSTIDCLIATFCIREGHFLLHNDRDFEPFEEHLGLKVLHP